MARKSLIGGLGELNNKLQDLNLLNNLKTAKPSSTLRGNNISSIIEQIRINVERHLGKFKDRVTVIRDETTLAQYFDKAIDCGYMAIDTETDGLDCLENHVIGSCLYVPGEKGVYVPHRHKSYITGQLLNNQISAEFMREQFKRLDDNQVKLIFHNAKFDMRIINSNFHVYLTPYWDTMIAAKLLNNLEKASLKAQYATHILHTDKEYDFSSLFKNIEYAMCPVEIAMLYAATDAVITWDLMQWQIDQFKPLPQLYNLFMTVEMPLIRVVCDMEDTGVALDFEYAKELSVKYTKLRDEALKDVYEELDKYTDKINLYKSKFPACKLSDPINVGSPVQLATFLYDILQIQPVDKKTPRGTGEEILEKINLPICAKILRCRGLEKLLGTYIDKMPAIVDIQDKRIHASFNTIGADTGRFSSDSPNLQNIPSNNHDIRKMFKATDGYYLLGSDYSQQEPKLLTFYTKDPDMMSAYDNNRDLYATVASLAFDKPYEDCLEFYPEGAEITVKGKKVIAGYKTHTNEEGKARRSAAKKVLLGIMYGRGAKAIAEQIHKTTKEAQEIIDKFYSSFPTVKTWSDKTVEDAKKNGYVETWYGRRRYLKDIQLPEYTFELIGSQPQNFNPLSFDDEQEYSTEVCEEDKEYYIKKLNAAYGYMEKQKIKQSAEREGIRIHDNSGKVAEAVRQCVNTRIQGGAADMTKRAMLKIYNNKEMQDLGFRLLIGVHDELIGECPKENAKRCAELLSWCMCTANDDVIKIKQKCDVEVSECWYGESITV